MEFQLYGHQLNYGRELENYNVVYKQISQYLYKMNTGFKEAFYNRFSNIDEVVSGGESFCRKYIDEVLDYALKCLANNGVYDYDYDRFVNRYYQRGFAPIISACNEIREERDYILMEQEEMREYRSERKDSRGRVSGGGFGLDNALVGMAQAGMMNAATGLAHSAVNAVGNAASSIKASNQKKSLFNSSRTVETYRRAVDGSMYMALLAIINAMNDNTNVRMEGPSTEDEEAAEAIFNNIKSGYISKEAELDKLIDIVQRNPYYDEAYCYLLENYNDENNELEQLAEYFGVFIVQMLKHDKMVEELSNIDYYNADKLAGEKEKYLAWAKSYGFDTVSTENAFAKIDQLHVLKRKTEDGFVYSAEEEAVSANRFINEMIFKVQNTDANSVEDIEKLIREYENSTIQSKDKYIQYLQIALQEEDIRFRTVKGKLYDSREAATDARKDALFVDEVLARTFGSKEEIEKAINDITNNVSIELKTQALEKLSLTKQCWEEQETCREANMNVLNYERKELSCAFAVARKLYDIAETLHINNDVYNVWFHDLEGKMLTVNGVKHVSAEDADKAYCKWVSHAEAYLKYITEKNSEKKSFFSSLKNNVTGLVNKNYESDYNAITDNGIKAIPKFTKEDVTFTTTCHTQTISETKQRKSDINKISIELDKLSDVEKAQLSAESLYTITLPISASEINEILHTVDEDIFVQENQSVADSTHQIGLKENKNISNADVAAICQEYVRRSKDSGTAFDEDLVVMEASMEIQSKFGVSIEQAVDLAYEYITANKSRFV